MPKTSVIVPNYNHGKYLKQRIDSILNQTYSDFELILLDDCSKDNSQDILLSYQQNPKISSILINEQNVGIPFIQWERGITVAQGEYIWIAESDDYADPHFLEYCMRAFERYSGAYLVYTGSTMVDENSLPIDGMDWDRFSSLTDGYSVFSNYRFLKNHLLWKNEIYNASMVVFKEISFLTVDVSHRVFRYCGDWLIWAGIISRGNVIRCNRKLNYFRQHAQKVSPTAEKEGLYFEEGMQVINRICKILELNSYCQTIIAGRLFKRLKKQRYLSSASKDKYKKLISERFSSLPEWLCIILYTTDKYIN